jgi:hypothetical protein
VQVLCSYVCGAIVFTACAPKATTGVDDSSEVNAVRAVVRCKQNSPDGEVNLRASPGPSGAILDVLKSGRSLLKVGEVPGPGCDLLWAKMEHDKGYVYGCRAILNCYYDKSVYAAEPVSSAAAETAPVGRCVQNQGVSAVNMRSRPSVYDSRVLAVLNGSASIRIAGTVPAGDGCIAPWYKLVGQTHTVYMCSDYAKCAPLSSGQSLPQTAASNATEGIVSPASFAEPLTSSALGVSSVMPSSGAVASVLASRIVAAPSRVELDVPYLCQHKNRIAPEATCQVTAFAMGYQFLTGKALDPDSLAFSRGAYQSPDAVASHARRDFGLLGSYGRNAGTEEEMKQELRAGHPIVLNTCGSFSGHVLVIVGYTSEGWIVNDPAGLWSGRSYNNPAVGCGGFPHDGGVSYPSYCNGKKVLYKYATLRRAASDGASTHNYWYTVLAK